MSAQRTPPRGRTSSKTVNRVVTNVDLGNEPALDPSGNREVQERQSVSPRWLIGSVMTGLGGGALLAAALVVSLEGSSIITEKAQNAAPTSRAQSAAKADQPARKGDKLIRPAEVVAAKQAYKAPMTLQVGDREVIKVRSFVRVATTLSTAAGSLASNVPPFNPLKMATEGTQSQRDVDVPMETSDAEVSFVKNDLSSIPFASDAGFRLSDDDVSAQIAEERRAILESGRRPYLPMASQTLLTRTLRNPVPAEGALGYAPTPIAPSFSTIEVRVVPENVTLLAKKEPETSDPGIEEKRVTVRRNETIETILRAHGATSDEIRGIVAALAGRTRNLVVPEGRDIKLLFESNPVQQARRQIVRVSVVDGEAVEAIAALEDAGSYVPVTPANEPKTAAKNTADSEDEEDDDVKGIRLYESFYETALRQNIPRRVIDELVRVFSNDVDFQRPASPDDRFEVFFADDEGELDLLYASMTAGGEEKKYYRFSQTEDGTTDYFDENGRSARRFLLPKPVEAGEFRSGFGNRRHPILGYTRMHSGVDWAAPTGTRIYAAGNGKVTMADWHSGYGRHVEIAHANGWTTTYSHLSGFAPGIREGVTVRQGQLIGFIGTTGLSTGAHLHYEVHINDRPVDPMRIRTPRSRELTGRALAEFQRNKEQVEAVMKKAPGSSRMAAAAR